MNDKPFSPGDSELVEQVQRLLHTSSQQESRDEIVHLLQQLLTPAVCRRLGLYPVPSDFLLSVVIPIYNEANTLDQLIQRVRDVPIPLEIILVDDGSTDGTGELLERWQRVDGVRVFRHDHNRGKGTAVRTGLAAARGDVVVFQDADLEYDPSEYPLLLLPILEQQADVVYGSRFSSRNRRVPKYWHYTVNRLITLMSNMSTNLKLTDVETCYKLIRKELVAKIATDLREEGFGIEIEITAKLAKIPGVRFHERPISYMPRSRAEGKKIRWRDGVRALWCILKY